jgi:hypothetical protein
MPIETLYARGSDKERSARQARRDASFIETKEGGRFTLADLKREEAQPRRRNYIIRKAFDSEGKRDDQIITLEGQQESYQNQAREDMAMVSEQMEIQAEKIQTGEVTLEYTKPQLAYHEKLSRQMNDIENSPNMDEKEKFRSRASLLQKQNAIVPQTRLNNKPPHKKNQGVGDTWQEGFARYTRDHKGDVKQLHQFETKDLMSIRQQLVEGATNQDDITGRQVVGKDADDNDVYSPAKTDYTQVVSGFLNYIKMTAMLNQYDLGKLFEPGDGQVGMNELALEMAPVDQREKIAKELGLDGSGGQSTGLKAQNDTSAAFLEQAQIEMNNDPRFANANMSVEDVAAFLQKKANN